MGRKGKVVDLLEIDNGKVALVTRTTFENEVRHYFTGKIIKAVKKGEEYREQYDDGSPVSIFQRWVAVT